MTLAHRGAVTGSGSWTLDVPFAYSSSISTLCVTLFILIENCCEMPAVPSGPRRVRFDQIDVSSTLRKRTAQRRLAITESERSDSEWLYRTGDSSSSSSKSFSQDCDGNIKRGQSPVAWVVWVRGIKRSNRISSQYNNLFKVIFLLLFRFLPYGTSLFYGTSIKIHFESGNLKTTTAGGWSDSRGRYRGPLKKKHAPATRSLVLIYRLIVGFLVFCISLCIGRCLVCLAKISDTAPVGLLPRAPLSLLLLPRLTVGHLSAF